MIYPNVRSTEATVMWLSKYICCLPDFLCIRIGTYFEFLVFLSPPAPQFSIPFHFTLQSGTCKSCGLAAKNASTGQNSVTQGVEAHD